MDLLFLACWTFGFAGGAVLIRKRGAGRIRLYGLMLLNLLFLAGLFYLYPEILLLSGRL